MAEQTADVENGWHQGERRDVRESPSRSIRQVFSNITDHLKELRRAEPFVVGVSSLSRPLEGYTHYSPVEIPATHGIIENSSQQQDNTGIRSTIHKNSRPTVLHATTEEITVNLASLQRIKILHLRQRLIHIAYDYRYAKRSILNDTKPPSINTKGIDADEATRDGPNTTQAEVSDPNPEFKPWKPEVPADPMENDADRYGEVLKEYTQAIRDWQFMKECWAWGPLKDPFILTTRRQPDFDMIKSSYDSFKQKVGEPPKENFKGILFDDYKDKPAFPGKAPDWQRFSATGRGAEMKSLNWKLRLELLGMAILGGSFLIVPVLIMVFTNTRTSSLVTTSVFVLGFGVVLAFYLDKKFDVLSGTAAYAAVLVVFVGITLESQAEQVGSS